MEKAQKAATALTSRKANSEPAWASQTNIFSPSSHCRARSSQAGSRSSSCSPLVRSSSIRRSTQVHSHHASAPKATTVRSSGGSSQRLTPGVEARK
jgi:hypothetical protein